jgi:hypothetical protein
MSVTRRAAIGGLIIAATTTDCATESISIRVTPAVAFAPAELVIRATIAPDANNRAVHVIAESDEFYRSSELHLKAIATRRRPRCSFTPFLLANMT